MVRLGSIGEVDALFTDRPPTESFTEVMNAEDVELHVAGPIEPLENGQ
jgi:hypothetical protein